jgi:hypothetical protein
MTKESIAIALSARKAGQFFHVSMIRPGKVRKGVSSKIEKASKFTCQFSEYSRRAPVREAVESGDRLAPELPRHVDAVEYIDGVKFWRSGEQYYLPAPVVQTGESEWMLDGQAVPVSEISALLLASELYQKPSKEETEAKGQVRFVAVKVENILSIG